MQYNMTMESLKMRHHLQYIDFALPLLQTGAQRLGEVSIGAAVRGQCGGGEFLLSRVDQRVKLLPALSPINDVVQSGQVSIQILPSAPTEWVV